MGSGIGGSLNACQSEDGYKEIEDLEFKKQGRRRWNSVPGSVMLVRDLRVYFLDRYSGKGLGSVAVAVDRGRGKCSSFNSSGAVSNGAGAGETPFNLCLLCLLNVTAERVTCLKGPSYELFSNRVYALKCFRGSIQGPLENSGNGCF